MIHTAWWQSTFISKIISPCQKIKMLHPWNENGSKINLTLRSKVIWKLWCYLTHRLIVAHLYPRYDKSMSKDKKVATRTWLFEYLKKNHKEKQSYLSNMSVFVKGGISFFHVGHVDMDKHFVLIYKCLEASCTSSSYFGQAAHTISKNYQTSGIEISTRTCIQMWVTSSKYTKIL